MFIFSKLAASMSSLVSMKTDIHVLSLKNVFTKPLKFIQSKWELATLSTGYSAGVHLSKSSSLAKLIKVTSISRSVKGFRYEHFLQTWPKNCKKQCAVGLWERISSLLKRYIRETLLPLEIVISGYDAWSCSSHLVTMRKDTADIMAM